MSTCGAPGWAGRRCELDPHGDEVKHRVTGHDATGVWTLEWYDTATIRGMLDRARQNADGPPATQGQAGGPNDPDSPDRIIPEVRASNGSR